MEAFAHGTYGDDSGVLFFGPPSNGFYDDFLAISNRFVHPIFCAIIDRHQPSGVPALVEEWNTLSGWRERGGMQAISPAHVKELVTALVEVSTAEVQSHVAGVTPDECVQCAKAIAEFLGSRLHKGIPLYIKDD